MPRLQATAREPDERGANITEMPRRKLTPWEAVALPSLTNITLALLVAVAAAGVAGTWALSRPAVHESRTVVLFHQADVSTDPTPGPILKISSLRRTYAVLLNTQPIVQPVAQRLQLPPGQVAAAVRADIPADGLVMMPTARARTPQQAQRIAQAVTEQLVAYVAQQQDADRVPPANRIEAQIVQPAGAGHKISPTRSRGFTVAGFAGILALGGMYVLLQLLTAGDPRRR